MIIDASALLAIVPGEADAALYARAIASDGQPRMPPVTWVEASMRIEAAADAVALSRFNDFPRDFGIEIIPLTAEDAEAARLGRRLYGRPHHPAALNFGDCLMYGAAKVEGAPLLFKGNDFTQTDITSALND